MTKNRDALCALMNALLLVLLPLPQPAAFTVIMLIPLVVASHPWLGACVSACIATYLRSKKPLCFSEQRGLRMFLRLKAAYDGNIFTIVTTDRSAFLVQLLA